jgi:hypothetical protein
MTIDPQTAGIITVLIVQIGQTVRSWLASRKTNKRRNMLIEKIEHLSFIPAFETEIEIYINKVLGGFTFDNIKIKSLALTINTRAKMIFLSILKIGFERFDINSVIANFDMQEAKIEGTNGLPIEVNKLIDALKTEREAFIIDLQELINEKTNGKRQEAFEKLCKNYILRTTKQIINL